MGLIAFKTAKAHHMQRKLINEVEIHNSVYEGFVKVSVVFKYLTYFLHRISHNCFTIMFTLDGILCHRN